MMAVALALALLLMQVPMALATDDAATEAAQDFAGKIYLVPHDDDIAAAVAAGREVYSVSTATWHGLPLLDEETNSLIASMLDSVELYTYSAMPDAESMYAITDISLGGATAIRTENIMMGEQSYSNSTLLPGPIAFASIDEAMQFYTNMMTYLYDNGMIDVDISTMDTTFDPETVVSFSSPDEAIAALDLQPVIDAFNAWHEGIAEGAPYDGDIISVLDAETASATLYQLTKDDLKALCDAIVPALEANTALWQYYVDSMDMSLFTDETGAPIPAEDVIAGMKEGLYEISALFDDIPDSITMYYAECYDANGDISTNIAHVIVPSEYDDESYSEFYAEWLPDCAQIHVSVTDDYDDGMTLDVQKGASDAEGMTDRWTAVISILSSKETVAQLVADCVWGTSETDESAETNGTLILGYVDPYSGEEMGVKFDLYKLKEFHGDDVSAYCTLDTSLLMGETEMLFLSLNDLMQTGEPQGMPFDPSDSSLAFVNPGAMDDEEFAAWMNEGVIPSAMQTLFSVMSLLPQDVFAWMMSESGMMSGM